MSTFSVTVAYSPSANFSLASASRDLAFWRDPADRVLASGEVHRHLGVYAYRRQALLRYAELPPSPLELERSLEQMRAMENGMAITALRLSARGVSVDTEDDLAVARRRLAARG